MFGTINRNGFSTIMLTEKMIVKKEATIAGTKVKSLVNLVFLENSPRRAPVAQSTITI
jgi:hypothetical protein